jgi:outer membrane protein OmpA-like peptidoglycan-associated protein
LTIKIKILLLLFVLSFATANAQSILRKPLTPETYPLWDEYITKYAPSDSAFRVVNTLFTRNYQSRRYAAAMYVLEKYKSYFPRYAKDIEKSITETENLMLTQAAQPDMVSIYDSYVRAKAPSENAFVAIQRMAEPFVIKKEWDSAAAIYRTYKPLFPDMERRFDKTIEMLLAPIEGIRTMNLGNIVNTHNSEWDPSPTPDGKVLFFSSSRPGGYGGEDVWVSVIKDGKWQKPVNVGRAINNVNNETVDNVRPDGNGLFLSGTFPGTFGQFDIYYVETTQDGWGALDHYPMPINSKYQDEGGNLSANGKALVFTSDRPGAVGGYIPYGSLYHGSVQGNMDIYVCLKTEDGWSQPINLGPTINTPYSERSAYLHPDGKTLYFCSEGHYGLGRLDVFKSVRLREDSWTEWSEPVNLGKEINGSNDDWGYKICLSGDSAFFAAENRSDGYGGWDLYTVTLPKTAKPDTVIAIQGFVKDRKGRALEAVIKWEDLATGENVGTLKSNPRDGSYIIFLTKGKNYGYYAEKQGYYPSSNNIDLRKNIKSNSITENIILTSIKEMQTEKAKVSLNNIFFDFDKFELKPESYHELDRLVAFIKDYSPKVIHIDGHTDNVGLESYNAELSEKRAESVRSYLNKKGITNINYEIKGYGASRPVAPNDSDENRALNRRVEIWFE